MNRSKRPISVFIPKEATRAELEEHPACQVLVQPDKVRAETLMSIDHTDQETVIELATQLYPERSFCLLNEQALFQQAQRIQQGFLPGDPRAAIAYAVKANPRGNILSILEQAGIRFADCSNPVEIAQVKKHAPSITPLHAYPYKTRREIAAALEMGVRYFTVQSRREVQKVLEVARRKGVPEKEIELAVRVKHLNPDAETPELKNTGIITASRELLLDTISLIIFVRGKDLHTSTPSLHIDDGIYTSLRQLASENTEIDIRRSRTKEPTEKEIDFIIFGRTCDSGDKAKKTVQLPERTDEGDYLSIENTGALFDSESTSFNGFLPPEYIAYNLLASS